MNVQSWTIRAVSFVSPYHHSQGSRGLMDRASDLKPEVVGLNLGSCRKCPRLRWDPWARHRTPDCSPDRPLLQVCVHLDGLNAENTFHCWLYSVYVTNKAHLSLTCICTLIRSVFEVISVYIGMIVWCVWAAVEKLCYVKLQRRHISTSYTRSSLCWRRKYCTHARDHLTKHGTDISATYSTTRTRVCQPNEA